MNCLHCKNLIIKSSPHANHVKFCAPKCRSKYNWQHFKKEKTNAMREQLASYQAPDRTQCVFCGLWYRAPAMHAWQKHKISARDYKRMAGLDVKAGLLPHDLKERKAEHVRENGTINNLKAGARYRFKLKDQRAGRYERSEQTKKRLLENIKKIQTHRDNSGAKFN